VGLVLYFAGAVVAHLRIKDNVATLAPAFVLFAISVGTLVLQIGR
jgi:hypothetical protein